MTTQTLDRATSRIPSGNRAVAAGKQPFSSPANQRPVLPQPKDAALLNALTIIAHDLRGPLANLAILLDLIDTHARMQAYDRMGRSTRRAQDLILALDTMLQGFLQRTRETGDPLSFRSALVDLADVVRDAVRQNGPMAESRGIALDCSRLRPLVISGDKRLLVEAVDNLVSNAVKHGPANATVACSLSVEGRDAIISIMDGGQGLKPAEVESIFEPFATPAPASRGRGSSWGLGLWIVRTIATRHGGTAQVQSNIDGGTTFSLRLPAELL